MVTPTVVISADSLRMKRRAYQHHAALHHLAKLELARHTQEWSNIERLGDLCNYPNALAWPSKLLEKSSALLDEKLSKLNLLRRLCKDSK